MFGASKTSTPSGGGVDPQFNYVTMLLHGDGTNGAQNNTFLDSSTNNFTITRNGNTTQGTFTPYGSNWSANFASSSTDYLSAASNAAFAFGTGDFTMEAFVFATASQTDNWIFGLDSNCRFRVGSGGALEFYNVVALTSTLASTALPLNTWTHAAVVRSGTALTIYQNGVSVGTATVSTNFSSSVACIVGNQVGFDRRFNGYISNARIVKGTAVYTAAFTPSTTPLTAITNTSLLTCQSNRFIDNSSNAFTLTVSGSPSVQRFNPFGTATAYSTSVIGGSGYFDDNDYLETPSGSCPVINNFSVSAWVYRTSVPAGQQAFVVLGHPLTGRIGFFWTGSNFEYNIYGSSTVTIDSSGSMPVNAWTYVVLTRTGSSLSLYYNGVLKATVSLGTAFGSATGRSAQFMEGTFGYAANLRFDTAAYPSPTTVPTTLETTTANTNTLLNFTNAGILDNAMMNDLETVGNAQISTSVKKYGTGSMYFDGSGDYLVNPYTPNNVLGSGDFTVEMWLYKNANVAYMCAAGTMDASAPYNTKWQLFADSPAGTKIQWWSDAPVVISTSTLSTGVWYHVAVTRASGTTRIFINGTLEASAIDTRNYSAANQLWVGQVPENVSARAWNGYIDDLRITKGYARYTTTFTPPTAALPDTGPY